LQRTLSRLAGIDAEFTDKALGFHLDMELELGVDSLLVMAPPKKTT
jgi:hypothetical protein